ncbi:hypothetical protein QTP88_022811 [Uroleucon formosanum]
MVVPFGINSMRRTPFLSQKTVAIIFLADCVTLNFLFWGKMNASTPLTVVLILLQNLAGTFDALAFVILCKHLWHPSCTTLSVSQITYDSVKRGLGYLQLFFKFSNSHSSIFTKFRLNLFLEITSIHKRYKVVDGWPPASHHASEENGLPREAHTEHGQIRKRTLTRLDGNNILNNGDWRENGNNELPGLQNICTKNVSDDAKINRDKYMHFYDEEGSVEFQGDMIKAGRA